MGEPSRGNGMTISAHERLFVVSASVALLSLAVFIWFGIYAAYQNPEAVFASGGSCCCASLETDD